MKKAVFVLLFLCAGPAISDGDMLERILGGAEQSPVTRAKFEQTKYMSSLKRPLVLSGRLTFSRRDGILWIIDKPYRMTYILSESRIVEIGSDGTARARGQSDLPGLTQISRVFRAMLAADSNALKDYFDVKDINENAGVWEIMLIPRQAQLAQFISGMRLSGARFVDAIEIGETNGDRSTIRFIGAQGDAAPNLEEQKFFHGEFSEKP
ncbi:MAG: outer membrane lipoprotein carrier protein LolA [Candidatus Accumulibacter sp.]|jgi:hypothetical protein|nr:outer membrane lipoprotein carrier protein LolA [Accumulibacter sp.]